LTLELAASVCSPSEGEKRRGYRPPTKSVKTIIRQLWVAVAISVREHRKLIALRPTVKGDVDQPLRHHGKDERDALEVYPPRC
jgi:hypothetical protein